MIASQGGAGSGPHPFAELLAAVAIGHLAAADGAVDVYPQPPGTTAAVLGFTGHHVVAADVDSGWVRRQLDPHDLGAPLKGPFLTELAGLLRRTQGSLDVVLLARGSAGRPALELVPLTGDHPRMVRAVRYRTDVRAYVVEPAPESMVLVGRGLGGRWETAFEVSPADRGRGMGRALARAARFLVDPDEAVWAQVAPGNAASLRALLAAGYRPVGAEVLFVNPLG